MRPKRLFLTWGAAIAFVLLSALVLQAADVKLEAQLVWGTNDKESPNPKHKPVEAAVKKRLSQLPLKFTNYFEVNRKSFSVSTNGNSKVELSDKCGIQVSRKGEDGIEVALVGRGSEVAKRTQQLPKGEMLVLGGNAPNETAWLVIVKRAE